MDTIILFSSSGALLLFLVVHVLIFRMVATNALMQWLVRSILLVAVMHSLGVIWWCVVYQQDLMSTLISTVLSLFFYFSAVFIYVNVFFGLATTSIRMQMLLTIAHTGGKGITLQEMLLLYNRDRIVTTRLSRLVASGEIVRKHGRYFLSQRVTPFRVYGWIHLAVCSLYGVK